MDARTDRQRGDPYLEGPKSADSANEDSSWAESVSTRIGVERVEVVHLQVRKHPYIQGPLV
jgi:hypothetical protein